MDCRRCGSAHHEQARFCGRCGSLLAVMAGRAKTRLKDRCLQRRLGRLLSLRLRGARRDVDGGWLPWRQACGLGARWLAGTLACGGVRPGANRIRGGEVFGPPR
jgi:hypothetical protein